VRACLDWQQAGLQVPDAVKAVNISYREESDILGAFVTEHLVLDPSAETEATVLYRTYQSWAEANGHHPTSQKKLALALNERGLGEPHKNAKGRSARRGVRVVDEATTEAEQHERDLATFEHTPGDGGSDPVISSGSPSGPSGRAEPGVLTLRPSGDPPVESEPNTSSTGGTEGHGGRSRLGGHIKPRVESNRKVPPDPPSLRSEQVNDHTPPPVAEGLPAVITQGTLSPGTHELPVQALGRHPDGHHAGQLWLDLSVGAADGVVLRIPDSGDTSIERALDLVGWSPLRKCCESPAHVHVTDDGTVKLVGT
jgi:hypothetical protein